MPECLILLYPVLVWWWCISITPASCFLNETDKLALVAFKEAIDQDPLGSLGSWNTSLHYCHWKGILCSRRHPDRVIELNLMSQGLVGSLSPHIGNLSFLQSIDLQNNSFHGVIPQEVGRLFRLRDLDFSNNSFHGEMPTNLSQCSNLESLNLIDNNMTGNILPELTSLSKLRRLDLAFNKLSGTIPPSLGNLSFLSVLSLRGCDLHGEIPKEISKLHAMIFIAIPVNNLVGNIPSGIYNISTISMITLFSNQLYGNIPPDIGLRLPKLVRLNLEDNRLTGPLPSSLSNASGLNFINFGINNFVGAIPNDLGSLSSLGKLLLTGNRLQGDLSFIPSLSNCTSLRVLAVGNNLLRGSLPDSIANLSTKIESLAMNDNQLHGSIPLGIGNLVGISYLDMSTNDLSGPIPATIGNLLNLHNLYLARNNLTKLPSSLGNLTSLNVLHLEQNSFYGNIPPSLGNCRNLLDVSLSHNNLSGYIHPEIISLSSISISFNFSHNALSGALPPEVGSLDNLAELDVSNNRFSGPVPNSLSNCLSLERLHLEGNSFEGEIPQSFRELRGLRELDLSRNNFSGLVPSFLGKLQLEKLNLSFNQLHGEVPTEGVFQNGSLISVVGNNDLCGGIPDLNLPPCSPSKSQNNNLSGKTKLILIVVIVLAVFLSSLVFIFFHRRRVSRKKSSSMPSFRHKLLRVSYGDLLKGTDGFSEQNLIGSGNYGSVYKGFLNHGQTIVAVKVLNLQIQGASKSFMSECKALRTVRHRNLLKILSACSSMDFVGNEFKALVCEFMTNGSLEKWLHQDEEDSRNLTLIQRLNIAIDVASALEYLHCHCESVIIHGDLKPSNVLLDDDMTAHVGDFGLSKIISSFSSELEQYQSNSTAVRGTIGYVAPEYGLGDRASPIADVYSYGILLLEMFTGKKPTDNVFTDTMNLHSFVKCGLPDQVMEIVNPCIILGHEPGGWIKDTLVSVLRIGIACSMESQRDRMQIQDVVSEIRKIKNVYENHGLSQSQE